MAAEPRPKLVSISHVPTSSGVCWSQSFEVTLL